MLTFASTDKKTLRLVMKDAGGNELGTVQQVAWTSAVPGDVTLTPAADGASCELAAGVTVPAKTIIQATASGASAALDVVVTGPAVKAEIVVS
jgi:hypothetical protein